MEKRTPRNWIMIEETEALLGKKIKNTLIYVLSTHPSTGKVLGVFLILFNPNNKVGILTSI